MAARPSVLTRVLFQIPTVLLALAAIVVEALQLLPRSTAAPAQMPQPADTDEQRRLYATPGGRYTAADIQANGEAPAAEKYRGILANHHLHPAAGERICPVTHTRANPRFAWTVDGQRYLFCCPPCIDEFVKQAKTHPESIRSPESYVQR
jgi:hypothetical protein